MKNHVIGGGLILLGILFVCTGGCINDLPTGSPGSVNVTAIPMTFYPVSVDEARAIALDDPEIQEKIQGYTIRTEVRRGQMGSPDASASHIVYIHVFDPDTGQHLITHLVPVSDEGEIGEKYYLTPSKIPLDFPQNLT